MDPKLPKLPEPQKTGRSILHMYPHATIVDKLTVFCQSCHYTIKLETPYNALNFVAHLEDCKALTKQVRWITKSQFPVVKICFDSQLCGPEIPLNGVHTFPHNQPQPPSWPSIFAIPQSYRMRMPTDRFSRLLPNHSNHPGPSQAGASSKADGGFTNPNPPLSSSLGFSTLELGMIYLLIDYMSTSSHPISNIPSHTTELLSRSPQVTITGDNKGKGKPYPTLPSIMTWYPYRLPPGNTPLIAPPTHVPESLSQVSLLRPQEDIDIIKPLWCVL